MWCIVANQLRHIPKLISNAKLLLFFRSCNRYGYQNGYKP